MHAKGFAKGSAWSSITLSNTAMQAANYASLVSGKCLDFILTPLMLSYVLLVESIIRLANS